MSNIIQLSEPNVDVVMATWTGLQLERGVSSTNLGSFQLVTQVPYVAGQTTYTVEDPSGTASDWYRTVRYGPGTLGTYSPPWPVQQPPLTAGDGARRSYKSCRRTLARRLGSMQLITTTADGNDQGTSFVCRALANQVDPNRYRSWWVMPADGGSAGQIRVFGENAVNVSSGAAVVQPAYLSKIVQGTSIELHKLLAPDEEVGPLIGLRQCLNLALAELWVLDRLTVTGTGAATLDISQLGDWLDADATYELYSPGLAGMPALPFGPYRVRTDASATNLEIIGLGAGATVDLELTRPGDTYMKVNGAWTDSQSGFVNDADECLFQPGLLIEVALAYAYEALSGSVQGAPQVRYSTLAEDQRRRVNTMKRMPGALPRPRGHTYRPGIADEWNAGPIDAKSFFG